MNVIGTRRGTRKADGSRAGASAAAFNPTSLIGTQGGFWRADVGVTGTSTVTAWADQGPHGNNLGLVGALTSPSWSATGFNASFAGVTFSPSAANSGLQVGTTVFNTATFSLIVVMSAAVQIGTRMAAIFVTAATNDYTTPSVVLQFTPSAASFNAYSSGQLGGGGGAEPFTGGVPQALGLILDGAHANLVSDFANAGAATAFTSTVGAASGSNFAIGQNSSLSGGAVAFTCAYCLATNRVLSGTDLTNLKSWTNSNWGTSF